MILKNKTKSVLTFSYRYPAKRSINLADHPETGYASLAPQLMDTLITIKQKGKKLLLLPI